MKDDGRDALFVEVGSLLRAENRRVRETSSDRAELERLVTAWRDELAPGQRPRAGRWRRPLLAGLTFVGGATAVALSWAPAPVEEALPPGRVARPERAGGERDQVGPATFALAGGAEVRLAPRARGRVEARTAQGADLRLSTGRMELDVRPRAGGLWSVAAGPYRVVVLGTTFAVTWSPEEGTFSTEVTKGRVRVEGPGLSAGMQVGAGERLDANAHTSAVSREPIRAAIAPSPAEAPSGESKGTSGPRAAPPGRPEAQRAPALPSASRPRAPRPSSESAPAPPSPGTAARPASEGLVASRALPPGEGGATKPPGPASGPQEAVPFRTLVAAGKYAAVVEAARRGGVAAVSTTLPAGELEALADAARYVGDVALARRALGALRDRFPGTTGATNAAFLLGRLAEERAGDLADAAGWYRLYLEEAPHGELRQEALGRLLDARIALGRGEEASRAAKQYLREFPAGPHAELARSAAR